MDLDLVTLDPSSVLHTVGMGAEGSALPAGTVTFLLTDVEGSSRLWEERADEMPAAITRHYELLDDAITSFGGVRPAEQGEGDSVVAAFTSAGPAVRAAIAAQRQLAAELPWLRVRMALYTGEARPLEEGTYVGRALNRCARLRACAHGGQIVLSSSTAALVSDDAEGFALTDLGVVHLRDLLRPERVAQVMAEGIPAQFPPLRALEVPPHNLPAALSTFVGRDRELALVTGLLRAERLVTLTGSGGCGKTRLALHAAAELVDEHPGGTWWVDLAPVTDGAGVIERIAGAIGAPTPPGVDQLPLVIGQVREQGRLLLVLDNAEHLVGDVARVVEAIAAGCPRCRVMVTSREPLGLVGEVVWRVPSLSAPNRGDVVTADGLAAFEAAQLFVDRALRVRPNLVLDDAAAAHVVAICARLDGIPLAIELAAARSRTVPLDRLVAGLDDAFRLLTGGARTAMPRQQTLLASIAWSFDLLDDGERAVLRRLAVFAGSFPLEAAEAVAGDGETVDAYEVLDVIGRLVDKSLVQLDHASGRYRMLETIRQFCVDRLRDARDVGGARDRHATWYASWCESLGRGEHDFAIDPSHPALDDVFAAFDWVAGTDRSAAYRICRGLGPVWLRIGRYRELQGQLAWLGEREADEDTDRAAWVAAVMSTTVAVLTLSLSDGIRLVERAAGEVDGSDVASSLLTRYRQAVMGSLRGDLAVLEEILGEAAAAGEDHLVRQLAFAAANARSLVGDFDGAQRAVDHVHAVLARRRLPFDARTAQECFGNALLILRERGELREARRLAQASPPPGGIDCFVISGVIGQLAYALGDHELHSMALAWQRPLEAAVRAAVTHDTFWIEFGLRTTHCSHALLERRYDDALDHLEGTYAMRSTSPAFVSLRLVLLGNRLLAAGRVADLEAMVDSLAADIARLGDPPRSSTDLQQLRALLARANGRLDEAAHHAHLALQLASQHRYRLLAVDALHLLGLLAHERGQGTTAARLLGAACVERDRIGYVARVVPDPEGSEASEGELRACEPDAWAEGAALTFDEAIEYASRARGERSRPAIGWASLTPTEARVAELVAAGLSNEEVGRRLLMGVATVKTHLTRVYAKTGLANRAQLAAQGHTPTR